MSRLHLEIPEDLMAVLHYYKDSCVMSCCGIAALNLDSQRAIDGMLDHGLPWAERGLWALDQIIESVRGHRGSVCSDQNGLGERWITAGRALLFFYDLRNSLYRAIKYARLHEGTNDEGKPTPLPNDPNLR